MIIRRKPLGTDNNRKPQSLGLTLLREGIARVQALTVRRSSEPAPAPDWGESIPQEVYDDIYAPDTAAAPSMPPIADSPSFEPAEQAGQDQFDPSGSDGFYANSIADAIARAEQPVPSNRPASNTARRAVRRQAQAPASGSVQRQAPQRAVVTSPPGALPAATPPAEITPALRPASTSPSGRPLRRQALADGDTMPSDLQAMWNLHKDMGHVRERPTAEVAQREAEERASRPRRRAAIVEISPPKKGLPLDVPDNKASSASPIGEPIQRTADTQTAATTAARLTGSTSGESVPASSEGYVPDYYQADDDTNFAPVNENTGFNGGDNSPEIEYADDMSADSAVRRTEGDSSYDSRATLVDFSNDVRRTAQNAPQSAPAAPPFAAGPTGTNLPKADDRADQAESLTVQRSPSGAAREFSPSPQVEDDSLAESDDEHGAASANPAFDPITPGSDAPTSVQRSAAIRAAIARAESPARPNLTDDTAAYDVIDRHAPPSANPPNQAANAPSGAVPRTPTASTAIQRAAAPTADSSPAAPANSANLDRAAAIARAESPARPNISDESADYDVAVHQAPPSANLPSQAANAPSSAVPRTPTASTAIQRAAAPTADSSPSAPANSPHLDRAAAIARAEQPVPPESAVQLPSSAPALSIPPARPVQRQVEKPGQAPSQPPATLSEHGVDAGATAEPSRAPTSDSNEIQRSAARAAAIARAEQPTAPDFTDFAESSSDSYSAPTAPKPPRSPNTAAAPAVLSQNAVQPPAPPQIQRTNQASRHADEADFTDEAPFDDDFSDEAAPAAAQSSVQRTARPEQYDAADAGFSDDLADATNSAWSTAADSDDRVDAVTTVNRSSARAAAIARAERPAEPGTPSNVPPLVQRAARSDQRSVGDASGDSVSNPPEQIGRPDRLSRRPEQPTAEGNTDSGSSPDFRTGRTSAAHPTVQRSPASPANDVSEVYDYYEHYDELVSAAADAPDYSSADNDYTDYEDAPTRAQSIDRAEQPTGVNNGPLQRSAVNAPEDGAFDYSDTVDDAIDRTFDSAIESAIDSGAARADRRRQPSARQNVQRSVSAPNAPSDSLADYAISTNARGQAIARAEQPPSYDGEAVDYEQYSENYSADASDHAVNYEGGDFQSPADVRSSSLPALPASRAVQRYAAPETETTAEPPSDSSQPPPLNWRKLRRKAQSPSASQPPQTPSLQRSADAQSFSDHAADAAGNNDDAAESFASAEEVDMLAMLGLPSTTRIARGPSQSSEAKPPPVIQRSAADNTLQRAEQVEDVAVRPNLPDQAISNNLPGGAVDSAHGDTEQVTANDVDQIAQEVYRQLRNRLRIERERTHGTG